MFSKKGSRLLTNSHLGAIGDVTRFATAKKLVGYGGLGTSSTLLDRSTAAAASPSKAAVTYGQR